MAEEKQEKKKSAIYKRILKWIGLAVLSVLIILGLIFQAPWKVITLLLIVLAACRILPKPAIKWFWLSVGLVVIALVIWVFLPDRDGNWRPYTFNKELAAIEAAHAIPDSENAATIYNQLLEDYNDTSYYGNLPRELHRKLHFRAPWTGQEHPVFMKWLNSRQDTIATLIEASKVEKCRFPIYTDPVNVRRSMKHINPIRRWTRLLTTAAYNDLGEDRVDEAFKKQMAVLALGKHQRQQPPMVHMLVGMASEGMALLGFRVFAVTCDATEQQLDTVEQAMAAIKHDWFFDRPGILEYDKLLVKNRFGEYYETDLRGRLKLSRDPKARIRAWVKDVLDKSTKDEKDQAEKYLPKIWSNPNYWQRKLIRAKTILYWFYLPSKPQKGAEAIDAFYEKYYKRAGADFDWKKELEEISPGFRLNFTYLIEHLVVDSSAAYNYRFHDIYLQYTAIHRGSRLIVALRRYKNKHGRWPETLDGIKNLVPADILVDPINGGSFVYKLTDENFTLYSKGKNNIDEGGKRSNESGADDRPIWSQRMYKPPLPPWPPQPGRRKTEKESTDAE